MHALHTLERAEQCNASHHYVVLMNPSCYCDIISAPAEPDVGGSIVTSSVLTVAPGR
jgi:hypothetical protein